MQPWQDLAAGVPKGGRRLGIHAGARVRVTCSWEVTQHCRAQGLPCKHCPCLHMPPCAVHRAGRVWAALRARTVLLFGAELAVQLINLVRALRCGALRCATLCLALGVPESLTGSSSSSRHQARCTPLLPPRPPQVFFLAPNALVLAQPCSWFLAPIHAFGIVRWTCWNTVGWGVEGVVIVGWGWGGGVMAAGAGRSGLAQRGGTCAYQHGVAILTRLSGRLLICRYAASISRRASSSFRPLPRSAPPPASPAAVLPVCGAGALAAAGAIHRQTAPAYGAVRRPAPGAGGTAAAGADGERSAAGRGRGLDGGAAPDPALAPGLCPLAAAAGGRAGRKGAGQAGLGPAGASSSRLVKRLAGGGSTDWGKRGRCRGGGGFPAAA